MAEFLLKDLHYEKAWLEPSIAASGNMTTFLTGSGHWAGRAMCMQSDSQTIKLDLNGPPGHVIKMYYGLTFAIAKDNWFIEKVNETVEVNPAHGAYFTIAQAQKSELENRIKAGLASIQTAVTDFELIDHDLRKYKDYAVYLRKAASDNPAEKREGELQLRTIFVDQVDRYVGGAGERDSGRYSMVFMRDNNIMPTIVDDFMRLESPADLSEGGKFGKGKIPEVERRMLDTKFSSYQQWKGIFDSTIKRRIEQLTPLAEARRKSIQEYREWLKPLIARHKMIQEGLSAAPVRKELFTSFVRFGGVIVSFGNLEFWTWKHYPVVEMFPTPGELIAKSKEAIMAGVKDPEKWYPLDKWSQDNLLFHRDLGMVVEYPWLTNEWIIASLDAIKNKYKWWKPEYFYYNFCNIRLVRTNIKYPDGGEDEDGVFRVDMWVLSQNVLITKLLQLLAIREEFEFYVNDILGLPNEVQGKPVVFYQRTKKGYEIDRFNLDKKSRFTYKISSDLKLKPGDWPSDYVFKSLKDLRAKWPEEKFVLRSFKATPKWKETARDFLRTLGFEFSLRWKPGPYERGFYERVTKYFLRPAGERFGQIVNQILEVAGYPGYKK